MTNDLFAAAAQADAPSRAPLPERMRPRTLDEVVGQDHLLAPGKLLREMVQAGQLRSLVLWGPPGCGKTTLARLLAQATDAELIAVSAVLAGVKELRAAIAEADRHWNQNRRRCVLFVDEIHRFNKAQQDALLPHVEDGSIVLIGATTENPSFEVNSALLSRSRVAVLNGLDAAALTALLERSLEQDSALAGCRLDDAARELLLKACDADARRMLGALELAAELAGAGDDPTALREITAVHVEQALQQKWSRYDRAGESHYDLASAMIKSLRDSDADAALYWCFRMIEAGEDPMFVVRRLVIFASEDIGNADPRALQMAIAVKDSVQFVGLPEARIPLAQACTYLATAPKSKASYNAMHAAIADVRAHGDLPVPLVMRNAPTKLMKELGYGAGYIDAHKDPEGAAAQEHRPAELHNNRYYTPTANGYEGRLQAWREANAGKR